MQVPGEWTQLQCLRVSLRPTGTTPEFVADWHLATFRTHAQNDHPGVVAKAIEFAIEMMRSDASLHADQVRRHVGKSCFHLTARPFLTQHNGATLVMAYDME